MGSDKVSVCGQMKCIEKTGSRHPLANYSSPARTREEQQGCKVTSVKFNNELTQ